MILWSNNWDFLEKPFHLFFDLCFLYIQSLIQFLIMFPWLWFTGSLALAHWLMTCHWTPDFWLSGFLAFWLSEFLVPRLCWFCLALVGSALSGFLFAQNDKSFSIGIDITVIIAVYLEKLWFFTRKTLPLLLMYAPRVEKIRPHSGCTVTAHLIPLNFSWSHCCTFIYLFVYFFIIYLFIAPMQAESDAPFCDTCTLENGSYNYFGLFSQKLFILYSPFYILKTLLLKLWSL